MGAYESFARVYDLFMDNVPYEEWGSYLTGLLREYGICSGTVAELGCGTGKMTRLLAAAGYDMIGVDNSEEMLEIARRQSMRRMRGVRQKHGTKLTKPMSRKNMQNWASRMNRKNRMSRTSRMSRMNRMSSTNCPMGEFSICSRICVNWNCTEACARWCRSAIP